MIRLYSPLSIDDCVERINADVDGPFEFFGRKPVIGSVNESRALLHKRLSVFVHNSFQPHLSVTFLRDTRGTWITCRFVLHPFVLAFLAFWAAMVLCLGGPFAIRSLGQLLQPNPPEDVWMSVLIPPGMLAAAAMLTGICWWFSSSDKDFLLSFLMKRVQAQLSEP